MRRCLPSSERGGYPRPPMSSPETRPAGHHRPVAAFDFDGTLARRDTLLGFLVQATSTTRVAMAMAAESRALASDRDEGKVRVLRRLLAGDDPERLSRLGQDYAVGLGHVLRPEMTERVRWHRTEGHELVIVSASLAYYLEPLARHPRVRPRHRGRVRGRPRRPPHGQPGGPERARPREGPPPHRLVRRAARERAVGLRRLVGRRRAARHGDPPALDRPSCQAQRLTVGRPRPKRAPGGPPHGNPQGTHPERRRSVRSLRLHADAAVDADGLGVHVAVASAARRPARRTRRRSRGASGTARPS